jgi:FkbM family methyltransferase
LPPRPLRQRLRRAARRVGLDVCRYRPQYDVEERRNSYLRRLGVQTVIDGGANEGQWATELRRGGYPGLIVSFEPVSASFDRLQERAAGDALWKCVKAALSDKDGIAAINVAGNSVSSSLLPMSPTHVLVAPESAYVGIEEVRTLRLDGVAGSMFAPGTRLALKLDVQGFEAAALAGATESLRDVYLIECELSVVPLYDGQLLYLDLISRLRGLGFRLASLSEGMIDVNQGRVLQLDGVFVRDTAR